MSHTITKRTPLLIGLYSETQGQGKSTVAQLIKSREGTTTILSFATPIKLATAAFLEACGLSDVQATEAVFDRKDTIIPGLGITGRNAMVLIGTKAGREGVSQDVWVRAAMSRADAMRDKGRLHVVFDDVRMPNEADAILERGGSLIKVTRPVKFQDVSAETEGLLNLYPFVDTIRNTGSLADLTENVRVALQKVKSKA